MKRQNMNLLVALDENYLPPLYIMLYSLFANNKWAHIHIYLMHSSIRTEKIRKLEQFVKSFRHTLTPIIVSENLFEDAPQRMHITKETYYRLLVMDYVDKSVKRILYLDPDIIVNHSLKNFYQCNMKNYLFAGAADSSMNQAFHTHKQSLGMHPTAVYINAGVLLINLEKLRKFTNTEEICSKIYRNYDKLKIQDQDLINMLYHPYIRVVSNRYNKDANYLNEKDKWEYPIEKLKEYFKHSNAIIHYLGPNKPWKANYSGKYLSEYWKYAKRAADKESTEVIKKNLRTWIFNWLKESD